MKEEEIKELFEQFEAIANEYEGVECWSARELAQVLGYSKWERFEGVIERAKDACINAGEIVEYHFPGVGKMIPLAKGAQREVKDYMLTRYACYLIAQNGDPRKPQISFAQNYFAVQTRRAELVQKRLQEYECVQERAKLAETGKRRRLQICRKAPPIVNLFSYKYDFLKIKLLCLDDEAEFAVAIMHTVFLHRLSHPAVDAT